MPIRANKRSILRAFRRRADDVVYAYGVDAEGKATTDVIVEPFKSLPVEPGPMVDCKIDIVAENLTSTSVKVVFNPSDPTVQYFYTMLDQAGYEDISKDWPGYIYEYMVSQLTDDGLPLSTIVMLSCSVGQQEVQSKTLNRKRPIMPAPWASTRTP